ncbi:MAG: hypothetical protein IKZ58_05015 [Selenomonadaceae bacterium]|nr:hypothetical protein [Selenomonadaceae bacterium]
MIERIAKIARVKRVENDVGRRFDDRQQNSGKSFLDELNSAMGKKARPKPVKISEPYAVDLQNTATQSLFYYSGLDLEALLPTR